MRLVSELKRRNVLRMAVLYAVAAWLIVQVAEVLIDLANLPDWIGTTTLWLLAVGFPIALIFSWFYEITPEGVSLEKHVDPEVSVTHVTGRRLDFIVISLLCAAVILFAYDKWWMRGPAENSVAVLPFVNLSDDANNEYFSDGISEELLNLLVQIPELRVISRSSSFSFKGKDIDIPTVAEQLNVAHVLEGSVRKVGNQVRVTAQLVDARSDLQLWSETYDRELNNIFGIQDEIAAEVVELLKITVLGAAPRSRVVNTEAYALRLKGSYFNNHRGEENWQKAVEAYTKALEIDPDYAEAWVGLSIAYSQMASWGFIDRDEGFDLAREAVTRGLELDRNLPEAHASLGWIRMVYDFDWQGADASYQEASTLGPGNATVLRAAAVLAFTLGRLEESIDINLRAIARDPLNQGTHQNLGLVFMHAGRLEESEQSYKHVLALNKEYPGAHMRLGQIFLLQGESLSALEIIGQDSDSWWRDFGRALALAATDRLDEADRALAVFTKDHRDGPFQIAELYAFRGEVDEAFKWLQIAYDQQDSGIHEMMNDPFLANLMNDERWLPFLERAGF